MSLRIGLSCSYWVFYGLLLASFCFLIFYVHSSLLDMNSFPPRNIKLGHILWWNSSAGSWDSGNNSSKTQLQPPGKRSRRTERLPATVGVHFSFRNGLVLCTGMVYQGRMAPRDAKRKETGLDVSPSGRGSSSELTLGPACLLWGTQARTELNPAPPMILLTCGTNAVACLCGAKARYFRYKDRDRSAQLTAKEEETPREAFESSSSRWLRLLISESAKGERKFRVVKERLDVFSCTQFGGSFVPQSLLFCYWRKSRAFPFFKESSILWPSPVSIQPNEKLYQWRDNYWFPNKE